MELGRRSTRADARTAQGSSRARHAAAVVACPPCARPSRVASRASFILPCGADAPRRDRTPAGAPRRQAAVRLRGVEPAHGERRTRCRARHARTAPSLRRHRRDPGLAARPTRRRHRGTPRAHGPGHAARANRLRICEEEVRRRGHSAERRSTRRVPPSFQPCSRCGGRLADPCLPRVAFVAVSVWPAVEAGAPTRRGGARRRRVRGRRARDSFDSRWGRRARERCGGHQARQFSPGAPSCTGQFDSVP